MGELICMDMEKQAYHVIKKIGEKAGLQDLIAYIKNVGWQVLFYDGIEPADKIIHVMGLADFSSEVDAFSYFSDDNHFIFIRSTIGETECFTLLGHEIGHILAGHLEKGKILDGGIIPQEKEANEFLTFLTHPNNIHKFKYYCNSHRKRIGVCCSIACIFLLCGILFVSSRNQKYAEKSQMVFPVNVEISPVASPEKSALDEMVFVTKSGEKYHKATCKWVLDKNCIEMTRKEAIEMGYSPCNVCHP